MDHEGLDKIISNSAATGQIPTVEEITDVLENHELMTAVRNRVGEAATRLAMNTGEATDGVAAVVELLGIDTETIERLERLPADYRDCVVGSYGQRYARVESYIHTDKLPKAYRLPELSTFMDQIEALAPTFEHQKQEDWQPVVEFVPRGLSRDQWDNLFKGHDLPNGAKTKGGHTTFSHDTIDDTNPEVDTIFWDVGVISATDCPVFTCVGKDGRHGSNAKKVVEALSKMPSVTDTSSSEAVITQASPDEELYNAMQLSRMERKQQPVDSRFWTISKENVPIDGEVMSVFRRFSPNVLQVCLEWSPHYRGGSDVGVRPSASSRDIKSQA